MAECARLESVYRETYRGFKSLILRQNMDNSPEVISDQNSCAELDDSRRKLAMTYPSAGVVMADE